MTKKALIVIDLQNDYFPGGKWTLSGIDKAAKNASRLLRAARTSNDLVIHIQHVSTQSDAPFFLPNSTGAQINQIVKNQADENLIVKHFTNSFRETNLKEVLDRNRIEHVVICGAMSHLCIDAATRASSDFGYRCTVVHDACASRDVEFHGINVPAEHVHAAFMSALNFGYAKVLSTDEYLAAK